MSERGLGLESRCSDCYLEIRPLIPLHQDGRTYYGLRDPDKQIDGTWCHESEDGFHHPEASYLEQSLERMCN